MLNIITEDCTELKSSLKKIVIKLTTRVHHTFCVRSYSQRIAGADQTMQTAFNCALNASLASSSFDYTIDGVKDAIGQLNDKRKERLLLLLEYIKDQGEKIRIIISVTL